MKKFNLYCSIFLVQISSLVISTNFTWTSPMIPKLEGLQDNPLGRKITTLEMSVLATLPKISSCLGSMIYGILSSKFGRKTILISIQFPCLFSYLTMAFVGNIWFFYISRFLVGFSVGGVLTILPMYCCELAEPKNRGFIGSSINVVHNIGPLISYCLGPFVSFSSFHLILASLTVLYIPLLYFFILESPYFFITRDLEKARSTLNKIRNPNEVDKNLKEIQEIIKNINKGRLSDIVKSSGLKKGIIIGLGLITFHHLTGVLVVNSYTQTIFENSGGIVNPEYSSIIIGVVQLIISAIFSPFTDLFPRKKLLMFSHATVALVQIPFGVYYILKENGNDVSKFSFIPLLCLVLFVIFINIGVTPLFLTYVGEIFPLKFKGIAISIIIMHSSLCAFLISFSFNFLRVYVGIGFIFLIFAFCGFVACLFITLFMIETKGKTLEQIQDELNISVADI